MKRLTTMVVLRRRPHPARRRWRRPPGARAPARDVGGSSDDSLTVWVGWSTRELNEFKKVVAEYDAKHADVTVEVVGGINDDKITAALRSGNGPDVVSSFTPRTSGSTAPRAAGSTSRRTSRRARST